MVCWGTAPPVHGDTRPRPIEASEPRMRSVIGWPVTYAIDEIGADSGVKGLAMSKPPGSRRRTRS
jgi:hypothetical protein